MGRGKLELPWRGKPIIQHVIDAWIEGGVTEVLVVAHPEHQALHALIRATAARLILPVPPPIEMKDSVRFALEYLDQHFAPTEQDVWLLAPADMPRLRAATVAAVLAAHVPQDPAILVAFAEGKRGHPVLFPWGLAGEVAKLPPDQGVNALLEIHRYRHVVCGSSAEFADIDTPADYARLEPEE